MRAYFRMFTAKFLGFFAAEGGQLLPFDAK